MDACIPDGRFRRRDPAFEGRERHKPKPRVKFKREDFEYDEKNDWHVCPNGKLLKLFARRSRNRNHVYRRYASRRRDCAGCPLAKRCLQGAGRKMRSLHIEVGKVEDTLKEQMMRKMRKIDLPESRKIYGRRMHIVEPVFGNIRHNKGMSRFMLRGKSKVNAQWLLYCAVHNIEKWAKNAGAELSVSIFGRLFSKRLLMSLRILPSPPVSLFESGHLQLA